MISLQIDRAATKAILARARAKVISNANRAYRQQVYRMFEDVLMVSPQFSGDFVSNWRIITAKGELGGYSPWSGKGDVATSQSPHRAGDPEAVTFARDRAARLPFTYKDKVYFVNDTPLVFTGTTVTGPDGITHNLRPENIIGAGVMIGSYLKAKYGGQR